MYKKFLFNNNNNDLSLCPRTLEKNFWDTPLPVKNRSSFEKKDKHAASCIFADDVRCNKAISSKVTSDKRNFISKSKSENSLFLLSLMSLISFYNCILISSTKHGNQQNTLQ